MSPMRRILLVATATLVWLGVAAAPASAHNVAGVGGTNFETILRSVVPVVPGLDVKVVEAGSRLEVENRTGQELVVFGYKGEPYLRIGPDGVFENRLSPATYLNRSRKGGTPTEAAEKAKVGDTDWAKISSEPLARWHDHRIHWMGNINPPDVRSSPGTRHVIKMSDKISADDTQWAVRMRLGNQDVVAKGDLVWQPGPSPLPWFALILVSLAVVVVIGRGAAWAPAVSAILALLLAIDVFHTVGLGLANAGSLGFRLTKAITQSPYEPLAWVIGVLAIVWLRRGRSDGLSLAALSGLQIALFGGIGDLNGLSRTVVPFGFGANLARLAVALSTGLGFGITAVAAMRMTGVGVSVDRRPEPIPDEAVAAPTGS
jgi:lysylphosphatidylglycerol synthetase-like protein (DUF2156 family)